MTYEAEKKLDEVLKNNTKWPLIVAGADSAYFASAVVLSARTPSGALGVVTDTRPDWIVALEAKAQTGKAVLCIDGLDQIDADEQEKFVGLLKYKGVNGYTLPDNAQIVMTVADVDKVSPRLVALSLVYRVE